MKLVEKLVFAHPSVEDVEYRLMIPSSISEYMKLFGKAIIVRNIDEFQGQRVMRTKDAKERWRRMKFFLECLNKTTTEPMSESDYDVLCSNTFSEPFSVFRSAVPPTEIPSDGDWHFTMFDRVRYRHIPGIEGHYLIQEVRYREEKDYIEVLAKKKSSDECSWFKVNCPTDFGRMMIYCCGAHFGRMVLLGGNELDMSCHCFIPNEARRLNIFKVV